MEALNGEIVQLLTTLYDDGRFPCAGASPLHIALDPRAGQVRLRGEGRSAYSVIFPEEKFVEMIQRSGMPPTETLIRIWLSTIYYNPDLYSWAYRIAPSETPAREPSTRAR